MRTVSSIPGEIARLARLHELSILDTAPEPLFDAFVRRAAEVCESPIALITLVDAERQWFKADVGLGGLRETPREYAFCNHTIQSDELMEVSDAREDERFAASPFVRDDPGVRFYAGAPLILPCDERVGSLCVLDVHPRRLNEAQRRELVALAGLATQALTMRRDLVERTSRMRSEADAALAAREAELRDLYDNAPCGYYSLDADGRFVRINGEFLMTRTIVHDISELHRTRDKLARLGSEQQAILDTELVGIVKLRDRVIVWANKGAEKMFGMSLLEVAGHSSRMFYPDDAAYEDVLSAARPLLKSGGVHRRQNRLRRRDGSIIDVDMSLTPMRGTADEVLCVLQDITELRRAEDIRVRANALEAENRQLVEAARVKAVFLANMSHELYTPLNAIIGYSHLLGTGAIAHDSPRFAKYLGDIGASGQQLLAQVQQVLALTDVESGRFDLRPRRTELRAVLESVVEVVLPECRAGGVTVELAVEPDSLELVVDPMRLSQVVSHLLSNAIRFSHAGGRVTLRARASGADEFRVEVEDHGIGIAPEDLPRLFTPFRQLSEGLAKTHGGAGLGLALTRGLVEAQGGSVSVRSTAGAGSVFSVTLPRFARGDAAAG